MCSKNRSYCTHRNSKMSPGIGAGRALTCPSNAPNQVNAKLSLKLLDNVLDISSTIAKILTICGLDDARTTQAVSRITHAFLHFDERLQDRGGNVSCKTRHLRKDDLVDSLKKECSMTEEEAKLTTSVAKCAFRAFYHKQSLRKYDAGYFSEDDWQRAAQRTIAAYAKAGASKSELEVAAKRIEEAYKGYINRVAVKQTPLENGQCDRFHQPNCYHCSAKTSYPNHYNQSTTIEGVPNEQVICSCCGCLKKSPVSYRDSKGRSILLKENNELFYNTQAFKQEVDAVRSIGPCGQQCDATLDDPLPRAIIKLTRDLVNKVIRNGPNSVFGTDKLSGEADQRCSHKGRSRSRLRDNLDSSPSVCDCVGQEKNRRKHGSNKDVSCRKSKKDTTTPPNSIAGDFYPISFKEGDAKVQIVLEGVCHRSETGRQKVDVLGMNVLKNEFGSTLEFVCKRRIRTTNRYTQTGGSAGASECASESSGLDKPFTRASDASGIRPSRGSGRKPSFGSTVQHSYANSLGSFGAQNRNDQTLSKSSKPDLENLSHKLSLRSEAKSDQDETDTHNFEIEDTVEPVVEVLHEFDNTIARESKTPSRGSANVSERDETAEDPPQHDDSAEEPMKEDVFNEIPQNNVLVAH